MSLFCKCAAAAALVAVTAAALTPMDAPSYSYTPGYLDNGDDVLVGAPGQFSLASAETWCSANRSCAAFTYAGVEGAIPAASVVYFKSNGFDVTLSANWSTYTIARPPSPAPPCAVDEDCNLNGLCDTKTGVCACDKPWGGATCGELRFLPIAGPANTNGFPGASANESVRSRERVRVRVRVVALARPVKPPPARIRTRPSR